MMLSSTRRRALGSAGKIALGCYFGAVSAACGGLSEDGRRRPLELESVEGEPAPSATLPDPSAPAASASANAPTPALACIAPVEVSERRLTTAFGLEDQACCSAYVESAVGTGPTRPGSELALDASLSNCCLALAYAGSFDTSVAHTTCCFGGVLQIEAIQAAYCSPWGPPVPPALEVA